MSGSSPAGARHECADDGFTLVELLVVMVVVAVLAAVAVPVYLHQRQEAVEVSVKQDLKAVALAEETHMVDTRTYLAVAATTSPVIGTAVEIDPATTVVVTLNAGASEYCITATHRGLAGPRVFVSNGGGLQDPDVTTCPPSF
ncbi:prepilin-type N-terminal cleavage/methylation domain-containing protein [Kineococcus arenarius]|uniref:prepilin-type N-terminal cleavage/methylation domain-containing protein n=1 Tax=unclassified Kineococcus TaxID=2621656 RepID=UPI003D7DC772